MADLFTSCTPFWDLILKFKIVEIQIKIQMCSQGCQLLTCFKDTRPQNGLDQKGVFKQLKVTKRPTNIIKL